MRCIKRARDGTLFLLAAVGLAASACATTTTEESKRQAILWDAATGCASGSANITVDRIDHLGRLRYSLFAGGKQDVPAFLECYQRTAREKLAEAGVVSVQKAVRPKAPSISPSTTPDAVPLQIMGNAILVPATLNNTHGATLLLDTGASHTVVTPETARRVGITPRPGALTQTLITMGGKRVDIPFTHLAALQLGNMLIEDFEIGVSTVIPDAPTVDGVLGGDVLSRFTITIDRNARQLRLAPTASVPTRGSTWRTLGNLRLDLTEYTDSTVTGTLREGTAIRGILRGTRRGSQLTGAFEEKAFDATITGDDMDAKIGVDTVRFKRAR